MPKVSVIVPVYKAEKYVKRCVESLFSQSLDDIEFIFIDDASPDNSTAIIEAELKSFPERCPNVHIVKNASNMGVAASRKRGIELATGEYVVHCDPDDWVEHSMYEDMYGEAVAKGYDIVVCDFLEESSDKEYVRYGKKDTVSDLVSDCLLLHGSLCNKLVKRTIVQNEEVIWPKENCAEDLVLSLQYSLEAKVVGYLRAPYYHYVRNSCSILGGQSRENIVNRHRSMESNYELLEHVLERKGKYSDYRQEMVHEGLYIKNLLLPLLAVDKKYLRLWKSSCRNINGYVLPCKIITNREKLNYIVTCLGLYTTYRKLNK